MWINGSYLQQVGEVGFLEEAVYNNERGRRAWHLREAPLHTNQSHEPRLAGWCGETDNVSRFARGMAKVVRFAGNHGERALIRKLTPAEIKAECARLGYPELAE